MIRTALIADLDAVAAAARECFAARLERCADHFYLMLDGERLVSFVDGLVTDEPDLRDEMRENADLHDENGAWQMIFGVSTIA